MTANELSSDSVPPTLRTFGRVPRPGRSPARLVEVAATPLAFAVILGPIYALWLDERFWTTSGRVYDLHANAAVLTVAIGAMFPLLAAKFDLSIVALAGMAALLTIGLRVRTGLPFVLVLAIVLAVGLLVGVFNGYLVGYLKINTFIATMATSGILLGAATAYSSGNSLLAASGETPVPSWFSGSSSLMSYSNKAPLWGCALAGAAILVALVTALLDRTSPSTRGGRAAIVGVATAAVGLAVWGLADYVTWPIVGVVVGSLLAWAALRSTVTGRNVVAIGANARAAQLAGVSVDRTVVAAFSLSGAFGAVAGMMTAGSLGAVDPGVTEGYLLPAYTAVFLSTVFASRGRFHPWGTLVGGFVMVEVSQGLVLGGVPYTWTQLLNGTALLVAVSISQFMRRHELGAGH